METNCVIYSRDIHSMNGVIHRLNNWGLIYSPKTYKRHPWSNNHSVTRCPRWCTCILSALASWTKFSYGAKNDFFYHGLQNNIPWDVNNKETKITTKTCEHVPWNCHVGKQTDVNQYYHPPPYVSYDLFHLLIPPPTPPPPTNSLPVSAICLLDC